MRWLWPAHTYRVSLFQKNQTVPGAGSQAGWPKGSLEWPGSAAPTPARLSHSPALPKSEPLAAAPRMFQEVPTCIPIPIPYSSLPEQCLPVNLLAAGGNSWSWLLCKISSQGMPSEIVGPVSGLLRVLSDFSLASSGTAINLRYCLQVEHFLRAPLLIF